MRANRQWIPGRSRAARAGLACLALSIFFGSGCSTFARRGEADAEAARWAAQIMDAMGGSSALRGTRHLRFDFIVEENGVETMRRSHWWDRETGRYRLETKVEGYPYVALFNVNSREGGTVTTGYEPKPAEDAFALLEKAYAAHISDSFWLLAATKLRDPGSHLSYAGEPTVDGRALPTLALSFDPDVGPTSMDRYWFHIDPQTRRPYAWSFVLKGKDEPPRMFRWTEWAEVGNLRLPVRFEAAEGGRAIVIDNLRVATFVEDAVYEQAGTDLIERVNPEEARN